MIVDERLALLLGVLPDSITEVSTTDKAEFGDDVFDDDVFDDDVFDDVFGNNMLSGTNA